MTDDAERVQPIRLLLIDDDPTMLMLCRRYFERCGLPLVVREARSGEQAIEMLRDSEFECVISDYRMGAVTGLDVLRFAATARPRAMRIMMSGFADPVLVSRAKEAAVHEFIEKPMTASELEAALSAVVVERHLRRLIPKRRADAAH